MRPVAHELEKALGEPVYHFANLHDDADVDMAHRFLVLHWCCSYKPESAYVRYLLKISGAKDVEELKAALIRPASYTQTFKMRPVSRGLKTSFCRFEYLLPDQQKTVAVLVPTPEGRDGAQVVLSQKISAHALIIAPSGLATKDWIGLATRYCRSSEVRNLDSWLLNSPVDTLTSADEWNFIVRKITRNENSGIESSEKIDDLMWLALSSGIETASYDTKGCQVSDLKTILKDRGAAERAAVAKARRAAFTHGLKEICLVNGFDGTGLLDENGNWINYDELNLPFPLIRRIALWQKDYEDMLTSPDISDCHWWHGHIHEESKIGEELEEVLKSKVAVKQCRWKKPLEISRNTGQLLGRLDALLPCLYLAHEGSGSRNGLRGRKANTKPGIFQIWRNRSGDVPGFVPFDGLILPLRLCRDEKVRAALQEIPSLIDNLRQVKLPEKRYAIQAKLDETFDGDLRIPDKEYPDGFVALLPTSGLFQRLGEAFDYVTDVIDNPADAVRITGASRFRWRSFEELMKWYYGECGADCFGNRKSLIPYLVYGSTVELHECALARKARANLQIPIKDPTRWFVLRPGLPDAQIEFRLSMETYGWAYLHVSLDSTMAMVNLSEAFDPFDELVAWGREIDEGDLPVQIEIDEEGRVALLTVLRTDDPARVLLRISRKYSDFVLLEGVVSRTALAASLKAELYRFFTTEFNPQHWDLQEGEQPGNDFTSTKDRVLNHSWFASMK
jgi:hypothetical protein